MEKKRDIKKEPVLTLLLLISGVIILSWVEQSTGYASYIQERPEVRGFTTSHSSAWGERGEKISEGFSNTYTPSAPAVRKKSVGIILQKTTTGYFTKLEDKQIIFVRTTQPFSSGEEVRVEYRITKEGEIVPLGMSKL